MSWARLLEGNAVVASHSPVESDRFGLTIRRVEVPTPMPADAFSTVRTELDDPGPDVVFLRYPAREVRWFVELAGRDRDLIFADTLIYWSHPVLSDRQIGSDGPHHIRPAGELSTEQVATLVADIFVEYANHYRADPLLGVDAALAGYQDWARRSVRDNHAIALEHDAHGIIGLATLEIDEGVAEVQLAGIRSDVQGRGHYGPLLAGCVEFASAAGCERVVISSQGHNVNVQRAWSRAGFLPVATFVTVHAVRRGLLPDRD